MRLRAWVLLACLLVTPQAVAHQIKTVVLNLELVTQEQVMVAFKSPLGTDGRPSVAFPHLTPDCEIAGMPETIRTSEGVHRYWQWQCPGGLEGRTLELRGLDVTTPDGIVEVSGPGGRQQVYVLDRHRPTARLSLDSTTRQTPRLGSYLVIGMEHILLGADHLLFVACLLLVLRRAAASVRRLLVTITAFTLAHSITLGMSVLLDWRLPPAPVEAVIALSILLLAVELARQEGGRQGREQPVPVADSLTFRHPELLAFAFGLLHGFGFAGALAEIGLPESARGMALLLFNLGVEAGQILFVGACLLVAGITARFAGGRYRENRPAFLQFPLVTLIGALSAYWFIDRLAPVITA